MPDSPFEHNAKQKLDELKFTPSESVWLQVKDQIGKHKRRRRMLIWIPLGCLLLAGTHWFLFSGKSAMTPSDTQVSVKKEMPDANQPSRASSAVAGQSSASSESLRNSNAVGNTPDKSQPATPPQEKTDERFSSWEKKTDKGSFSQEGRTNKKISSHQGRSDKSSSGEADKLAEHILDMQSSSATDNHVTTDHPKNSPTAAETALSENNQVEAASPSVISDSSAQHRQSLAKAAMGDSLKTPGKKPETHRRQAIQWGIVAGGGFSSLPGKGNEGYPYLSVGNGSPGGGYSYSRPVEKHSSSFYLGLRIQKKLTETTSLFSGLQYTYASVKIASGNLVNQPAAFYSGTLGLTSVTSYYAVLNNKKYNYRNQYHFLEIPLGIEHQFAQRSRFSFDAGISAAWLFASNALLFDPRTGIYFKHNAYLNKLQWNVLGGIQYSLLRTKAYDLKIGPHVQYGLTGVVNRKMSYTEHRLFGGIQILLSRNEK